MSCSKILISPHPPVIIPEIGEGRESDAIKTIEGMEKVGQEVLAYKPELIIYITPHGNSFRNGTCFLFEEYIEGDFSDFGNDHLKFRKKIDLETTQLIGNKLDEKDIINIFLDENLADIYNGRIFLDHGVLVPLNYIDKYYSDYEMVHITPGFTSLEENYKIGKYIKDVMDTIDKRVLIVISGDLSHCLKDEGPYEYNPMGEIFDRLIQNCIREKNVTALLTMDEDIYNSAGQCGLRPIVMGLGLADGMDFDSEIFSYEGPFGVGYMTASITINGFNGQFPLVYLKERKEKKYFELIAKEDEYIKLARTAINHYVNTGKKIELEDIQQEFSEHFLNEVRTKRAGAFVSINKAGDLRGCIGTISPVSENIAEEIINNAIHAASEDPRFSPILKKELKLIIIKVDILSEQVRISSKNELNVRKYGVIVQKGNKRGVLLPNLEGVEHVDDQINIAKRKAGINEEDEKVELFRFEVQRHEV